MHRHKSFGVCLLTASQALPAQSLCRLKKSQTMRIMIKSIFAPISLLGVNKEQESITLKEAFDELPFTP